ncbi:Crp/Fnr family transcriptional regulator [Leptospira sp. GIMC2001]|uniref:Crp/Fnr family transcriptional regulator n=1 Tax=Leptospira sp. GIMC2001 TaxID=1513297 RepID=UPI00234BA823|nr:Crp/Fnr family transcriptional regulator [Leptospira sp. GIMC2001]WCL49875.1 Crp/Fnr family transcriptional regulator [Leptospira sp. GIMC2001]
MTLKWIERPTADTLIQIFQNCKRIDYKQNEFLFHSGDTVEYLDLLVEGSIQIFKYDGNLNEMTLNFFNPINMIAEWAVLLGIPYPASGRFAKDSTVYRMPISEYQNKLNSEIGFNHLLMFSLLNKIDMLNSAINRGLTMDSLHRVAHFLYYSNDDLLRLKQNQIASLLYLRPETFSRTLKQFKDQGIIRIDKGRIEILNREDLKELIA